MIVSRLQKGIKYNHNEIFNRLNFAFETFKEKGT